MSKLSHRLVIARHDPDRCEFDNHWSEVFWDYAKGAPSSISGHRVEPVSMDLCRTYRLFATSPGEAA